MKKFSSLFSLTIFFCSFCFAQQIINAVPKSPQGYFLQKDLMTIGSYYYPEQWPVENWEKDIKKMSEVGFDFTHYGEFAWAFMEPEEGRFDFTWLDKAVDLANKYGIKVVMCTPTPTPPVWLVQKHPEILMVNAEGRTIQHGARQQASWSSPVYREYVSKIVDAIGKHYANDKRIWGWQLDNEPSHYGQYDYSPAAQEGFQRWLKTQYKTIENLNTTWGTAFWSLHYNDFNQVHIPNQKELVQQANPHAILDFKRFSASEANDFLTLQYNMLRKHIPDDQWITTNLMPEHVEVDPTKITGLDFLTYTKYLVAGYDKGIGEQGFRMGSASSIGFANDLFRSFNGVTGVMELQPGQVNWGKFNPQPMPGVVRMWIWHAFAGGNKFVCNYRFDRPITGGEQYHYSIINADGITVSTSGIEYIKAIEEMKQVRKAYDEKATMPLEYKKRQAAILYNADGRWEMDYQPQSYQWNYMDHLKRYYNGLKQLGAPVDVITEDKDFSKYPVLIAPAYQLLDTMLVNRWKQYAENGGHLILTCRTAQKDRNAKMWQMQWAEPIYNLIGAKIPFYDLLPDDLQGKITWGTKNYTWNNWADIIEPMKGTEVWATYSNQYYAGKAAVVHHKLRKGTVTFVGPDTDEGALEKSVLTEVYKRADIKTTMLPDGVIIDWRDGFWVGVNYSSTPFVVPLADKAKIIVGSKILKPADVVVWKE